MNSLLAFPVWVAVRIDRLKAVGFLDALLLIDSGNRSDILPVFTDLAWAERYLTERGGHDAVPAAVRTPAEFVRIAEAARRRGAAHAILNTDVRPNVAQRTVKLPVLIEILRAPEPVTGYAWPHPCKKDDDQRPVHNA
jgi:hypothetical protein